MVTSVDGIVSVSLKSSETIQSTYSYLIKHHDPLFSRTRFAEDAGSRLRVLYGRLDSRLVRWQLSSLLTYARKVYLHTTWIPVHEHLPELMHKDDDVPEIICR